MSSNKKNFFKKWLLKCASKNCRSVKSLLRGTACKLCNSKYMITLTQTTNTEIFAFTADLGFKLLNCKDLLINKKSNRTC